ncbi:MAG: bifunctional demethylmenaquinone methyltransferase/2-methoxy-6-polyprenyl-1,4-benzoquinol methylase UbiE [Pseudomonadota bacterium]
MIETSDRTTHFGFRDVAEGEKAGMVHGVFSSVASKYDVMNDVMSFRIHRLWKEAMIDWMAPRRGMRMLDVAGGTGDISFRTMNRLKGDGHATVFDMTQSMLDEGKKRAEAENLSASLDWVCGDAMALPFEDKSFDFYTIAFGIRNVTRVQDALNEAHRVLKPGGRFLCLEFSRVDPPLMEKAYDLYSFNVIPRMGEIIAKDRDSYQYLVESIRKFPPQEEFAAMIREAGFSRVQYRNQTLGVAAIHSGWRI